MKTFEQFQSHISELTERLEPHHDLSVYEFEVNEDEIEEEGAAVGGLPTNAMGQGQIPGANIPAGSHFGEPGVPLKKRKFQRMNGPAVDPRMFGDKIFGRKPPIKATVEEVENTFAGAKVFTVDPDTYHQCRLGKNRYHRWSRYVGDSEVGQAIKTWGKANTQQPIIVMNSVTGDMMYLRNKNLHDWKPAHQVKSYTPSLGSE